MANDGDGTRSRSRSPSYPGVALEQCIDRARLLYEHEHRNPTPPASVLRHWGYSNPTGGAAAVALAALKKFGLLEETPSQAGRMVKLTPLALDLILNPDEDARRQLIQEAALNPPIHRELWEKSNGHLPSDATLRYDLERNRKFTASGASDFIRQFRDTVAFAGLVPEDTVVEKPTPPTQPPLGGKPNGGPHDVPIHNPPPAVGGMITIPILLPGNEQVQLAGRFPISEAAWTQLIAVLGVMKAGMVKSPDEIPQGVSDAEPAQESIS